MSPHSRTRTGCWTCRGAGYKCDEQKPHCGRCVRLQIACKGYETRYKWRSLSGPPKEPRRRAKVASRPKSREVEDDRVSTSSYTAARETASNHVYTGSSSSLQHPWILPIPSPMSALPADLDTQDQRLYHHWVSHLSALVSISPDRQHANPFQTHLTGMSHCQGPLRSTLLSMSARHLLAISSQPSFRFLAYRNQRNAILELRNLIQNPDLGSYEAGLATVLMMQLCTRLFAENDEEPNVANHLAGAQAMILRKGGLSGWRGNSTTRFLSSLFSYHDILSSVARGTQPLLEHENAFSSIEDSHRTQKIAQVLQQVARTSTLQHLTRTMQVHLLETRQNIDKYEMGKDIEASLLGIQSPTAGDPDEIGLSEHVENTAQAYRHAAFIYLYRVWKNFGAPHPLTLEHVHKCLEYIKRVPATSPLASSHVWPLFTAGCEAVDTSQRQFVRQRFEDMYASRTFPSLVRVMRDIEEVWRMKDVEQQTNGLDGMSKVDCIQVIWKGRGREVDLA